MPEEMHHGETFKNSNPHGPTKFKGKIIFRSSVNGHCLILENANIFDNGEIRF